MISAHVRIPWRFREFLDQRELIDFRYRIDQQWYPAHKVLLFRKSRFFSELFLISPCDSFIPSFDYGQFHAMISFIYDGVLERPPDMPTVVRLYAVASFYGAVALQEILRDYISGFLASRNANVNKQMITDLCSLYVAFQPANRSLPLRVRAAVDARLRDSQLVFADFIASGFPAFSDDIFRLSPFLFGSVLKR
jgi:hypothetical protein